MFEGKTDIDYLNKHNIKWWNEYTETNENIMKMLECEYIKTSFLL